MPRSDLTGAVVLAAGESRRAGGQKLVLPFAGSTVIACVVEALTAAGATPVIVVVGRDRDVVATALAGTHAEIVENPDPSRGMLSSARVGVAALPEGLDRFLIALGDQPRLAASEVSHLLREHRRLGRSIAIATHQGKRGHPVVFDSRHREGILALTDDQTLRDVIHRDAGDVADVDCGTDAVVRDIDTREDYETELRRAKQ